MRLFRSDKRDSLLVQRNRLQIHLNDALNERDLARQSIALLEKWLKEMRTERDHWRDEYHKAEKEIDRLIKAVGGPRWEQTP